MRVPPPAAGVPERSVDQLLVASCRPCHSSEREMPWYARLAPSSWVSSARTVLDLSDWASYDAAHRGAALSAIATSVSDGGMPPGDYTFFDHAAALNAEERQRLASWASAQAAAIPTH